MLGSLAWCVPGLGSPVALKGFEAPLYEWNCLTL